MYVFAFSSAREMAKEYFANVKQRKSDTEIQYVVEPDHDSGIKASKYPKTQEQITNERISKAFYLTLLFFPPEIFTCHVPDKHLPKFDKKIYYNTLCTIRVGPCLLWALPISLPVMLGWKILLVIPENGGKKQTRPPRLSGLINPIPLNVPGKSSLVRLSKGGKTCMWRFSCFHNNEISNSVFSLEWINERTLTPYSICFYDSSVRQYTTNLLNINAWVCFY